MMKVQGRTTIEGCFKLIDTFASVQLNAFISELQMPLLLYRVEYLQEELFVA